MTDVAFAFPLPPLVLGHEIDLLYNHYSSSFRSSPATRSVVPFFITTGFRLLKGPHQLLDPPLHAKLSLTASRPLRHSASPKFSTNPTFHNFGSVLRVLILVILIGVVVVIPQHISYLLLHTAIIAASITTVRTPHLFYLDEFGNLTIVLCPCDALIVIATFIPKSQPPPLIATSEHPRHPLPSTIPPHRPRSPPPAWSPRQTPPVSGRSPLPTSSPARPQRPKVILPPTLPQRPSSASPTPRLAPPPRLYTPPIDGSHAGPLRVRPLPVRPPPPGPPSEGDTPIAPFGKLRWTDSLMLPEDEDPSLCDDRRAIDWDLIDEVMKHAS
ncbi:hypothetical protein H4582DRAFT_2085862 [Lactarius indigo]|nr:hypothetical protein H4582DRAFT_2085862 [Lactarius indigo]